MGDNAIFLGLGGGRPQHLLLNRANRHGLIAGATGTGKTVSLQRLAEGFSAAGVPVFLADVKGDLAGLAMPGSPLAKTHDAFAARAAEVGLADFSYDDNPVTFWDLYGEKGHPIRTTVTEMGPLLLARLMGLNEAQEGVLSIAFRVADEEGLLLLNLEDLQALLAYCAAQAQQLSARYGNVTKPSVGAIQRELLQLQSQGGDRLFGEPALAIADLLTRDEKQRGTINILAADRLMADPRLYATFLLWLLSELFETLPEIGDPERPSLVFFFDEAHLLFDDVPKALEDKIEQVVRLSARKAWASISLPKTRSTSLTKWRGSSAIACSMRCAPSLPRTRRRSRRPPKRSAPTRRWMSRRPSPSSRSAKRSFRCCRKMVHRRRSSGP